MRQFSRRSFESDFTRNFDLGKLRRVLVIYFLCLLSKLESNWPKIDDFEEKFQKKLLESGEEQMIFGESSAM